MDALHPWWQGNLDLDIGDLECRQRILEQGLDRYWLLVPRSLSVLVATAREELNNMERQFTEATQSKQAIPDHVYEKHAELQRLLEKCERDFIV